MLVLFHDLRFLLFLVPILALYWVLPQRGRNPLLLIASYAFYASWNTKLVGCIVASTLVDYCCGLAIHRSGNLRARRWLLFLSVGANLGMLGFFKYCNFFTESLVELVGMFGVTLDLPTLDILLPIGISFYTFQTMSYSIDIYRGKLAPTTNLLDFSLFVIFFPQLIAGPIEKARDLLPQLQAPKFLRQVEWRRGIYLFVYGWFLKVVLADPVGVLVAEVFGPPDGSEVHLDASGAKVLLALYGYALQIYCDFAGYSKMARGLACFFGVRLSRNFYMPFYSRGYVDFYKRWHITLSSWIGEYVYMPLYYALPRTRLFRLFQGTATRLYLSAAIALLMTRIAFGLWHGASMTFVLLGIFIYFGQVLSVAAHQLTKNTFLRSGEGSGFFARPLQCFFMVHMFAYAMLFFRSHSVEQVQVFSHSLVTDFRLGELWLWSHLWVLGLPALFIYVYDYLQYRRDDEFFLLRAGWYRQLVFALVLVLLWLLADMPDGGEFIYFQF